MTNDFNDLLSNVRIVEWDQFYAAPGASALLGDMGAEVISIERFDRPSPTRTMRHIGRGDFTLSDGSSGLFETVSRNKSSVALNMHDVAGQELAREMVRNSDVFLTNFREPSLVRAGMNSKLLTAEHPGLIYSKVSGFGPEGPRSDQSGFDFIVQGYSGMMHRFGDDSRELGAPVDLMLDQTASIFTALSIIAALYHRERTGHGQVLDL